MKMINSGRISVHLQERHLYHMTHEMTKNFTNIERNGCVCITNLNLKFTGFYVFCGAHWNINASTSLMLFLCPLSVVIEIDVAAS